MQTKGIRSVWKRKFIHTTDSLYALSIAEKVLNPQFKPVVTNVAGASDIPYVRTRSGWQYPTSLIDFLTQNRGLGECSEHAYRAEVFCLTDGYYKVTTTCWASLFIRIVGANMSRGASC